MGSLPKKKYISIQEAAKYLDVSTKTLRRWEASGVFMAQRTKGGHRRYSTSKLEELKAKTHKKIRKVYTRHDSQILTVNTTPLISRPIQQITDKPNLVVNGKEALPKTENVVNPIILDAPKENRQTLDLYKPLGLHPQQKKVLKGLSFSLLSILLFVLVFKTSDSLLTAAKQAQDLAGNYAVNKIAFTPPLLKSVLGASDNKFYVADALASKTGKNVQVLAAETAAPVFSINIAASFKEVADFVKGLTATDVKTATLEASGNATFGNISSIKGVPYTFPATQGGSDTFLKNDGAGALTWGSVTLDLSKATGVLPVANGGTNNSASYPSGSIIFSDGTKLTSNTSFLFDNGSNTESVTNLKTTGNATFGNITAINGVTYSFPTAQGVAASTLTNDGAGTLSWVSSSGSGPIGYWTRVGTTLNPSNAGDNIGTTGKVGAGTLTPLYQLDVQSSIATDNGRLGSFALSNTNTGAGTTVNGLYVTGSGSTPSSGTNINNLINLSATAATGNTFNGINFGSNLTNYINGTNWTVTAAGAETLQSSLTSVGVNSQAGLIQGTGGLSLSGTANINTAGTANTTIGNGVGTFALNLGSDATGDVYYRNSGGTLSRVAIGGAGQVLTVSGSTPGWVGGVGGTGSAGFWSRSAGGVLSPITTTDTLNLTPNTTTGTGASAGFNLQANSLTTGNGVDFSSTSLTTGNLFNLSSTSTVLTSGAIANFSWSPSSATATGDILRLNVGSGGVIGNILNVQNNSSTVFGVSQTQISANLPTQFTTPGDVGIAYDLQFTNQISSTINTKAPLYIQAGELFESNDLTLRTFNLGNILLDTGTSSTGTGKVGVGPSVTPTSLLTVSNRNETTTIGQALGLFDQGENQDIIAASNSGTARWTLGYDGKIVGNAVNISGSSYSYTDTLLNTTNSNLYSLAFTNAASSGSVSVNGANITATGTASSGTNTNNLINLSAAASASNNTFNGINFGSNLTNYINGTNWTMTSAGVESIGGKVGIGPGITPTNLFIVSSTNETSTFGQAVAIFNQTENQEIITASQSGVTKFSLKNLNTNFGAIADTGAFISNTSYMGQEFNSDISGSSTSNSAAVGDDSHWYVNLSTTSSTESWLQGGNTNGFARLTLGATSGRGAELAYGETQNTLNTIYLKANLPVVQMKIASSLNASTDDVVWGLMDTATAPTADDSLPTNGIFFWHNNGTSWVGVVRSGGVNVGTVTCSGTISTSQFAVGRINVISATSVDFYMDNDASDGIQMTYCGNVAGANPTAALGLAVYAVHNDTNSWNVDVDYMRTWQDDAASNILANVPVQQTATNSATPLAQTTKTDSNLALFESAFTASSSGIIGNLHELDTTKLSVLGDAVLGDTVVNGKLNVGGLTLDNTTQSINAIGVLKIQDLSLGNVEFMNGLIVFDTNGNITVHSITANKYKVAGTSAGTGTITAGSTSTTVTSNQVNSNSLIFVTAQTTSSKVLSVTEKTAGTGFKVEIPTTDTKDLQFSWWIVDKQ